MEGMRRDLSLPKQPSILGHRRIPALIFRGQILGVWIRFLPMVKRLQTLIHDQRAVGHVLPYVLRFQFRHGHGLFVPSVEAQGSKSWWRGSA
jgi:hypothetical protein